MFKENHATSYGVLLTLEFVSTFTSVVIFLLINLALTSAKNNSPFLVPVEVMACNIKRFNKLKDQRRVKTENIKNDNIEAIKWQIWHKPRYQL